MKSKCIKLLDDGSGKDPLETYNFGSAANYLFRPCQNEDGSPDEVSSIFFRFTNGCVDIKEMKSNPPPLNFNFVLLLSCLKECDIRWMSAYEDDSPPKETFLRPLTPVEVA